MEKTEEAIENRPPNSVNRITILSIDGGGVRGIIPGVILGYLESQLQELDGEDVRLADYFDVIAGTSTGGVVAAVVSAPNENQRPLYAAKDIVPFFLRHSPKIFPQMEGAFAWPINVFKATTGPSYDGKYLHQLIKDTLESTRLHQTLTNVVIPTFDIKALNPVIFNSFEAAKNPELDALLSDVCIGTTAAPTLLPPHSFTNTDSQGNEREFNLIDGVVAANNPTLVAISEVSKQVIQGNPKFFPINPTDYDRFIVISLGAGSLKNDQKYGAEMAAKWGPLGWLYNNGDSPLLVAFQQATADMVDFHISLLFQARDSGNYYLRIQDDTLTGTLSSVDVSTKENLENLVKVGKNLLNKQVSRVNLASGVCEPIENGGTNMEALQRYAKLLSEERKFRESNFVKA